VLITLWHIVPIVVMLYQEFHMLSSHPSSLIRLADFEKKTSVTHDCCQKCHGHEAHDIQHSVSKDLFKDGGIVAALKPSKEVG
jgi:hypothetical protein